MRPYYHISTDGSASSPARPAAAGDVVGGGARGAAAPRLMDDCARSAAATTTSMEGKMTGYLRMLVALVVALMATVGGSQDAKAVNGMGLNAQPESDGSLFHLAADRVEQAKWDKCQREAMLALIYMYETRDSNRLGAAGRNAIRWRLDERIRWVFEDVHPGRAAGVMNAYWRMMRDDNPGMAIHQMCKLRDKAELIRMNADSERPRRHHERNVERALEYMENLISEIRTEISRAE